MQSSKNRNHQHTNTNHFTGQVPFLSHNHVITLKGEPQASNSDRILSTTSLSFFNWQITCTCSFLVNQLIIHNHHTLSKLVSFLQSVPKNKSKNWPLKDRDEQPESMYWRLPWTALEDHWLIRVNLEKALRVVPVKSAHPPRWMAAKFLPPYLSEICSPKDLDFVLHSRIDLHIHLYTTVVF